VLTVGPAGSWDSSDVLNPSVIQWNGTLYNYYSGFGKNMWSTGVATSIDGGLTWTKYSANPVLVPPVYPFAKDPYFPIAANGSAVVFNGQMYHYYEGYKPDNTAIINLAVSSDGLNFSVQTPFFDVGAPCAFDDAGVADP
jgi:predicted GH43/DUF377 family glycosyl hydrolase